MSSNSFSLPLVSSCIVHLVLLIGVSFVVQPKTFGRQNLLPIDLVDLPRPETRRIEAPPAIEKALPPPPQVEKAKEIKAPARTDVAPAEKPAPRPAPAFKEEPQNAAEPTAPVAAAPTVPTGATVEGGGSAAGAGNLFGKGDAGVAPGAGASGGGGGTAAAGLGRGGGAPGLPAQTAPLRTNRAAKPLQTVRANYPAMALRAGLEADVTLKIAVDSQGNVTQAEITQSGGAGFDEEALKAVKQSRFEPAQKDGQNVPAEFTYIYKFRLQR